MRRGLLSPSDSAIARRCHDESSLGPHRRECRGSRGTSTLIVLMLLCIAAGLSACGSSTSAMKARIQGAAPVVSIVTAPVEIARTSLGSVGYRSVGTGAPLVLITGFGATMEDWYPPFVDGLAQRHRVVIFDNAGVGQTQALPAPLTVDAMAEQTSALLDTLHLGTPAVLGWSMGGMIAQALAVRHPRQVGRLVLCATQAGTGQAVAPPPAAAQSLASEIQLPCWPPSFLATRRRQSEPTSPASSGTLPAPW